MRVYTGLLVVTVVRATNLKRADVVGSSDPYVVISNGYDEIRSKTVYDNLNPVWNEELKVSVEDKSKPLLLKVFDEDTVKSDDFLGSCDVDLSRVPDSKETEVWCELTDGKKKRGQILLKLEYTNLKSL